MTVQSLERTFADKVFAICDYYIDRNIKGHSRHIYDLYMLLPKITFDEEFKKLVKEIQEHRATMHICPSAMPEVNISKLLTEIKEENIYKTDYKEITTYFQNVPLEYNDAIEVISIIIESNMF